VRLVLFDPRVDAAQPYVVVHVEVEERARLALHHTARQRRKIYTGWGDDAKKTGRRC
jgi:hypothetical protein